VDGLNAARSMGPGFLPRGTGAPGGCRTRDNGLSHSDCRPWRVARGRAGQVRLRDL